MCASEKEERERRRERGVWARALGTNVGVLGGARATYKKNNVNKTCVGENECKGWAPWEVCMSA